MNHWDDYCRLVTLVHECFEPWNPTFGIYGTEDPDHPVVVVGVITTGSLNYHEPVERFWAATGVSIVNVEYQPELSRIEFNPYRIFLPNEFVLRGFAYRQKYKNILSYKS